MRKVLISAAIAASALVATAPAAAQYYPQLPQGGYYPQPEGNAYGYNNRGQVQRLMVRIDQIRRQIARLDQRNILSNNEARRLNDEARDLQRRVARLGYNGLDQRERYDVEMRIARLEQRVRLEARDGDRRYGQNGYNGYRNGYNGYGQNGYNDGRWQDRDGRWGERADRRDRDDRDDREDRDDRRDRDDD